MVAFRSFEEIEAWKKARMLVCEIYGRSRRAPFAKDFSLRDQIQRASVSIMSNIAEGFERGGKTEFIRFLTIAKGSAGEVRSQLYVALDQGYLDPNEFGRLFEMVSETSRMINGLMNYLRGTTAKQTKPAGRT